MRYALIDWDNTIHRGYTIYGLADHLVAEGLVDERVRSAFMRLRSAYKTEAIDYADYTIQTCEAFAAALEGRSLEAYRTCVAAYVHAGKPGLFEDAPALFELLHRYRIGVYLVSGAPAELLRAYRDRLGISDIFAFELEEREGLLTGKVACNYGVDKGRVLRNPLFLAPENVHVLSMGDAVADVPLLDNGIVPIIVGENALGVRPEAEPLRFLNEEWDLEELERRLAASQSIG